MNHPVGLPALVAAACTAVLLGAACTRIVQRPTRCPVLPPSLGHSAVGWQQGATSGIRGSVVAVESLAPLEISGVTLTRLPDSASTSTPPSVQTYADAGGRFRFDSAAPGRYALHVRRIGYQPAHDTIQLHGNSGIVATVVLAVDMRRLEECGLTYEEVRIPWWKR